MSLLETRSLCRAGSTKRVAAAVGEGAAVVSQSHLALAFQTSRREHSH
jgi:hypothetical protein